MFHIVHSHEGLHKSFPCGIFTNPSHAGFSLVLCKTLYLYAGKIQDMTKGYKETIFRAIITRDDVLFHWCLLTVDTEDKDADTFHHMLVDLSLVPRPFPSGN